LAQHSSLNDRLDQVVRSLERLHGLVGDAKPLEMPFPYDHAQLEAWSAKLNLFLTHAKTSLPQVNFSNFRLETSLPTGPYYRLSRRFGARLDASRHALVEMARGSALTGSRYSSVGRHALFIASDIPTLLFETLINRAPSKIKDFHLSVFNVHLSRVADLTDPSMLDSMNLKIEDLITSSWDVPRQIGNSLFDLGYQAIKAPSPTRLGGYYIIIFIENTSEDEVIITESYNLADFM